jgi:hypothetical protein
MRQSSAQTIDQRDAAFTNQTGHNVNAAANGIARVLRLLANP